MYFVMQDAAEIVANKDDWPILYDEAALKDCKVPTAALSKHHATLLVCAKYVCLCLYVCVCV